MDEQDFMDTINEALYGNEYMDEEVRDRMEICSFQEQGLLTKDRGLVINIDGSEFQVTVKKVANG